MTRTDPWRTNTVPLSSLGPARVRTPALLIAGVGLLALGLAVAVVSPPARTSPAVDLALVAGVVSSLLSLVPLRGVERMPRAISVRADGLAVVFSGPSQLWIPFSIVSSMTPGGTEKAADPSGRSAVASVRPTLNYRAPSGVPPPGAPEHLPTDAGSIYLTEENFAAVQEALQRWSKLTTEGSGSRAGSSVASPPPSVL